MEMQDALTHLNWLAIVVAALSTFLIGGLWYSPLLFGKQWMSENNFTEDELRKAICQRFLD